MREEHHIIKYNLKEFKRSNDGIDYKCKVCNGTGLNVYKDGSDLTLWDGTYCDNCKGIGKLDFIDNITKNGVKK